MIGLQKKRNRCEKASQNWNFFILRKKKIAHLLILCWNKSHSIMCLSLEQLNKDVVPFAHDKLFTFPECPSNSAIVEFVATSCNEILPNEEPTAITSKLSSMLCSTDFNFLRLCPL